MNINDRKAARRAMAYDLYLSHLKHQLEGFKDYVLQIEDKFTKDIETVQKQFDDELRSKGTESSARQDIAEWYGEDISRIDDVFIRTFRYSTVVSIYSILETSMNSLCKRLLGLQGRAIELGDLKGDGIERARICMTKVCAVQLSDLNGLWSDITKLNKVRNCIVHAAGNIELSKSPDKLMTIIKTTNGLKLEGKRYIRIEPEYIDLITKKVEDFLETLYDKAFNKQIDV